MAIESILLTPQLNVRAMNEEHDVEGLETKADFELLHPAFRRKATKALSEFDEAFHDLAGSGTPAERARLSCAVDDLTQILAGTMIRLE